MQALYKGIQSVCLLALGRNIFWILLSGETCRACIAQGTYTGLTHGPGSYRCQLCSSFSRPECPFQLPTKECLDVSKCDWYVLWTMLPSFPDALHCACHS